MQIMRTQYHNNPAGHCGNEDCGQMSAWYIFSALGFYPVNPADGKFYFGMPLFSEITLNLDNGKTFVIKKEKEQSAGNEVYLNHKLVKERYITYKQLMQGGELLFK